MKRSRKKNDLRSLQIKCETYADNIISNAKQAQVNGVYAAHNALVWQTPVDTSQAKSNWRVSVNAPLLDNIKPYFPGEHGSTAQQSSAAALAQAWEVLKKYELSQGSLYIANGLPYILKLNDGWSDQAPAGFIRSAVRAAVRAIAGVDYLSAKQTTTKA